MSCVAVRFDGVRCFTGCDNGVVSVFTFNANIHVVGLNGVVTVTATDNEASVDSMVLTIDCDCVVSLARTNIKPMDAVLSAVEERGCAVDRDSDLRAHNVHINVVSIFCPANGQH